MDEGVQFYSHIDGSKHLFTPENVIKIQRHIGSDICMVLDECLPYPCEYSYAKKSLDLTHQWLDRSINEFSKKTKSPNPVTMKNIKSINIPRDESAAKE